MAFKPQFSFGEGLSYTTFAYKDLRVDKPTISVNDELSVTVTVTNTGQRAGKEAVLVYVTDLAASISPPNRRLRRFAKVNLQPNQSRTLTFILRRGDLSFIGADNKPTVEPGDFEVKIGDLSQRFTLR
jgi:beta-glucosidase